MPGFGITPPPSRVAFKNRLARVGRQIDKLPQLDEVHQRIEEPGGILPSQIILLATVTLVGLQEFAGLSIPFAGSAWKGSPTYPYQGNCFQDGSQDFAEVAALLRQAVPQSWRGAAADAYTTANDKLIKLAETMVELDLQMERLVRDHAEVVSQTQLGIGIEQDILVVALPIIFALEKNPATFPAAWKAAKVTAAVAISAAVVLLSWCLDEAAYRTAQPVDRLGYGDVLAAAQAVVDPSVTVGLPQSGGSVAPDFAPVSGSVSGSLAISGTPSVASPPGSATGVEPPLPWLNAPTGGGQRTEDDSAQVAAPPERRASMMPASPMPSVAQVIHPSGQAANRSGSFASPGSRINPHAWRAALEEAVAGESEDTGAAAAVTGGAGSKVPATYAALGRSEIPGAEQTPAPTPAA